MYFCLSALPSAYSDTKKLICSIISIRWKRGMWKGLQRSESLLLIAITAPIKENHFHSWGILCPISVCLGALCFRKLIHKSNVPKPFPPPTYDVFVCVFPSCTSPKATMAKFVMILCTRNYLSQYVGTLTPPPPQKKLLLLTSSLCFSPFPKWSPSKTSLLRKGIFGRTKKCCVKCIWFRNKGPSTAVLCDFPSGLIEGPQMTER